MVSHDLVVIPCSSIGRLRSLAWFPSWASGRHYGAPHAGEKRVGSVTVPQVAYGER